MKRSELLEEVLMGKACVIPSVAFETLCKRAILEVLIGPFLACLDIPASSFHSLYSFGPYSFASNDWTF